MYLWFIPLAVLSYGLFPRKNAQGKTTNYISEIFGPFQAFGPFMTVETQAFEKAKRNLEVKEGRKNVAYLDSRKILTVGIGHKAMPEDGIVLGQRISEKQIDDFFTKDIGIAFNAAKKQAKELGKYTPNFIAALTSVNFQLGTGWPNVFKNTYADLKKDNEQSAINRLLQSDWYSQTPVRVVEFISAIKEAYA